VRDLHTASREELVEIIGQQQEQITALLTRVTALEGRAAERSLHPAVIARKSSGDTRSGKGSRTKMGLMSLLGTWAAQGQALLPCPMPKSLSPTLNPYEATLP
jgi:hypothetical protein